MLFCKKTNPSFAWSNQMLATLTSGVSFAFGWQYGEWFHAFEMVALRPDRRRILSAFLIDCKRRDRVLLAVCEGMQPSLSTLSSSAYRYEGRLLIYSVRCSDKQKLTSMIGEANRVHCAYPEKVPLCLSGKVVTHDLPAGEKSRQVVKENSLVVVGSGGVGKSALVIQFIKNTFVEVYNPTIEENYRRNWSVDGGVYLLDILDTAGQEDFQIVTEQYIKAGDGFLLVYSIEDRQSFDNILTFRDQILRVKDATRFPMLLVGNKCDLVNRSISTEEGVSLARSFECPVLETSAKEGTNIEEVFTVIAREVLKTRPATKKKKGSKCTLL
ncbi:hypothetical protein PROFUN_05791 [Planoprotostelium fungivorum]|uniref:Uncharacterized protein n=1 Tax=Planoprotostelium fungivorum TaxID=1890364 RepID=A0A2P6NPY6_9EUKA|nr:hypothetical protein PROFUN_05791 [Planoprotostelium fungivorum]